MIEFSVKITNDEIEWFIVMAIIIFIAKQKPPTDKRDEQNR